VAVAIQRAVIGMVEERLPVPTSRIIDKIICAEGTSAEQVEGGMTMPPKLSWGKQPAADIRLRPGRRNSLGWLYTICEFGKRVALAAHEALKVPLAGVGRRGG
jgi:hypothetical protein